MHIISSFVAEEGAAQRIVTRTTRTQNDPENIIAGATQRSRSHVVGLQDNDGRKSAHKVSLPLNILVQARHFR